MSLPYYRFFPGDYARDTRHLSMLQHGAYRLLIDMYMENGEPIPNDLPKLYRWLRAESLEEKAAVEFVLAEFFVLGSGKKIGWIHKRCEVEWQHSISKREKAVESAKERWNKKRKADAMRTHSEGNANQNQNQNQRNAKEVALAAAEMDPIWGHGLSALLDSKIPEQQARAFLGALLASWEAEYVIEAITASIGKVDPRSYIRSVLKAKPKRGQQEVRRLAL